MNSGNGKRQAMVDTTDEQRCIKAHVTEQLEVIELDLQETRRTVRSYNIHKSESEYLTKMLEYYEAIVDESRS
jgi:hypothetical protein